MNAYCSLKLVSGDSSASHPSCKIICTALRVVRRDRDSEMLCKLHDEPSGRGASDVVDNSVEVTFFCALMDGGFGRGDNYRNIDGLVIHAKVEERLKTKRKLLAANTRRWRHWQMTKVRR